MLCSKYNSERETLRNIVHETGQEWSILHTVLKTGQEFRDIRRGLVGYKIQALLLLLFCSFVCFFYRPDQFSDGVMS